MYVRTKVSKNISKFSSGCASPAPHSFQIQYSYYSVLVMDWVRTGVDCGRSTGKRVEVDQKSFGVDGKQKDLASTCALHPHAHRCPISESRSDRKGNRGNRSQYSDWRYRREHLSIYTNYVFHLEQVWRDREWRS